MKAYTNDQVATGFVAHIETNEATFIPDASTVEIHIVAEVRDNQGRALAGNDDSSITFNVEYTAGSALKTGRQLMYSTAEDLGTDGRATIELSGWTTDDSAPIELGPVKVTVTAMYVGPTGNLEIGKVELSRGSTPTKIVSAIFSVGCLMDPEDDAGSVTDTSGYKDDMFVMKDNDDCEGPIENPRFGAGDEFIVKAIWRTNSRAWSMAS